MNTKIYLSLLLTAAVMVVGIALPCIIMMSNTLYDTFESMATQKLDRSISSCKNYINSAMLSGANLALDNEIISVLEAKDGRPITNILNNACDYALTINGITVYSDNGTVYTSSNVADVPSRSSLQTNQGINDFMELDNNEYVSLRTDNVPKIYGNTAYNTSLGVVSCCQKVYSSTGLLLGEIFVDILPSNLYQFFTYEGDSYFSGTIPYISFSDDYFRYGNNYKYYDDLSSNIYKPTLCADRKYLLIPSNRNFFGGTIRIAVPMSSYNNSLSTIISIFIIVSTAFMLGVHLIAMTISGRVNNRMTKLYKKMQDSEYDFS